MDVFWRLEVPTEKHYSALITFLDIYFAYVMFPLLGRGKAHSPDPTPIFDCVISGMKWNELHESVLCISNEYR